MITATPIFNRKKSLLADGRATISIRLTLNRVPSYYSTRIKIIPEHWDKGARRVNRKCKFWREYNDKIDQLLDCIEGYNAKCISQSLPWSVNQLKSQLDGKDNNKGLTAFIEREISLRTNLAVNTLRHHNSKLRFLKEFVLDNPDITLLEINYDFIQRYDNHLTKQNLAVNTKWAYHKFLKTYLNIAIKKELLTVNPYAKFKITKEQGQRDYLTFEELKKLEALKIEPEFKQHQITLDKFLFSCYTGLRISDLSALTKDNFREEQKKLYLTFRMSKTIKIIRDMPLHDLFNGNAIKIYKKYRTSSGTRLFPEQTEQHINSQLKDLAKLSNINKKVTFHVSRHTFGSALARVYNDVLLIKELMGHTKIDTSMIYIHMNPAIIEEKLKKRKFEY